MAKETTDIVVMMCQSIGSRHRAAEVLNRVAEMGQAGLFPQDVTCEQLGRALFRIMMNAPEEDPLTSLIKGFRSAEKEDHQSLLDIWRKP